MLSALSCQRSEDWNNVFHRKEGWWYSDGGSSAKLPNGKTVWLFGDTWLHKNPKVLFNSIAVQDTEPGRAPRRGEVHFFARRDSGGLVDVTVDGEDAARSFAEPTNGAASTTWLWPTAALAAGGKFIAFYTELGCAVGEFPACRVYLGNMGFVGHSVLEVDNPTETPERWKTRMRPLLDRRGRPPSRHQLHWGSALLEEDGWLYIFGTSLGSGWAPQDLKLARVVPSSVGRYDLWQFLTPQGFRMLPTGPVPDDLQSLARGAATELSVHRVVHDGRSQFVMVQVDPLSQEAIVRTAMADDLESARWAGPESTAGVRRFPLAALDPNAAGGMNWAGRAHPHHSKPGRLLVSFYSERTHRLRFLEMPLTDALD